jgi:succinyl-diaminopimelate desuccinylase
MLFKERREIMKFNKTVDSMKEDIIRTTQELIKFKSVETTPEPGAPFGRPMRECLDRALEICAEMGFKTKNIDGYAGHAECGEGEEIVGILVHMDVVPEGSGWSVDPYGGQVIDDKLYGRGSIDDKGPAAAVMYALKAVKDSGEKFNKRVRIIFGCDEESGRWDCMKHYFQSEEMPSCGFSPDADFPIINSEMGIIIFNLSNKFSQADSETCTGIKINSIKGGNRPNMVPDYCECELEMQKDFADRVQKTVEYMKEKQNADIKLEIDGAKYLVKSFGISAHGSTPDKGINAISQMISFLGKLPLCAGQKADFVRFMESSIGMETDGTSFGLDMRDDVSGKLVFNLGVLELNDQAATATINIRYPVTKTRDEVYDAIKKRTEEAGIMYNEVAGKAPLYVPADNPLVQKLSEVYQRITGEEATLISIGGGTYSRAIKNAVAFGPLFPGQLELAHQKDEYIGIDDLMKCTKLYAEAISELIK